MTNVLLIDSALTTPVCPADYRMGDQNLVTLWQHGQSVHTQRVYRTDLGCFMRYLAV